MSQRRRGDGDAPATDRSVKSFAELNALRQSLKELQVKYDNLLHSSHGNRAGGQTAAASPLEEQARQRLGVESHTTGADASSANSNHSSGDFLALQQSNHSLQSAVQSLQSALAAANEDADRARSDAASLTAQLTSKDELLSTLRGELDASRTDADSLRAEQAQSAQLLDQLASTVSSYESRIAADETRMVDLESSALTVRTLAGDKADLESLVDKLRTLLLSSAAESSARNQSLLNALNASRSFLSDLSAEFLSYASGSRAEFESYRQTSSRDLAQARQALGELRAAAAENAQAMHGEQVEVVESMQAHFLEYRQVVEGVFAGEALKLESKLEDLQKASARELEWIHRAHAHAFQQMVTTKDAKIMALIEGSDHAQLVLAHAVEIEQLRRASDAALASARAQGAAETKRATAQLRKDLLDRATEIESLHGSIVSFENKLNTSMSLLSRQKKLHALREADWETQVRQLGAELAAAHTSMESLRQSKEALRHRLLKVRLQLEGREDMGVPAVIKRLERESKRLAKDLAHVSFTHQAKSDALAQLQREQNAARKGREVLERELENRTREFVALTKTMESVLSMRLRGGVAGVRPGASASQPSLYDPAVTRTLRELSAPIREALAKDFGEGGDGAAAGAGGASETMLRATAKKNATAAAGGTMVGLRLGPSAVPPSSHSAAHDDDELAIDDNDDDASTLLNNIRRRSILFDESMLQARQSNVASRASQGGAHNNEEADTDASIAPAALPLSGEPSTTHSRRSTTQQQQQQQQAQFLGADVLLPAASTLSSRPSPIPGLGPQSYGGGGGGGAGAGGGHGRHISFNPSSTLSHFGGGPSRTTPRGLGSHASSTASLLHLPDSSASSLEVHGASAMAAAAAAAAASSALSSALASASSSRPDSVVPAEAAADLSSSSSRQSRLHDLIKSTPAVSMPSAVRRVAPAKSLRELHRREEEARRLAAGPAEQQEQDDENEGADAARPLTGASSSTRSRPRFQKPARLMALEASAQVVDLDLLKGLERGFQALQRFKALSREFEADAKGRKKILRDANTSRSGGGHGQEEEGDAEEQARADMDGPSGGVGAFSRKGGRRGAWSTDSQAGSTQGNAGAGDTHQQHAASSAQQLAPDLASVTTKLYTGGGGGGGCSVPSRPRSHAAYTSSGALGSSSSAGVAAMRSASVLASSSTVLGAGPARGSGRSGATSVLANSTHTHTPSRAGHYPDRDDDDGEAADGGGGESKRLADHALALDFKQYVDPQRRIEDMGVVSHQGEETRLYQGASSAASVSVPASSAIPWWSSAATPAQQAAGAAQAAAAAAAASSATDAAGGDRRMYMADAAVAAAETASRYRPKPPSSKRAF